MTVSDLKLFAQNSFLQIPAMPQFDLLTIQSLDNGCFLDAVLSLQRGNVFAMLNSHIVQFALHTGNSPP
jgi:hypothetical protein